MRRWRTADPAETRRLGSRLAEELRPDGILLLDGDLGAGKTVLAQGIGAGLGIAAAEVVSPTFTLIREHRGDGGLLIHVDLYRLEPEETETLGLDELLAGPGVKVVEWADRLPFTPPSATRIEVRRCAGGVREFQERARPDGRAAEI